MANAVSVRKRGMRQVKEVVSPWDADAKFTIRKATNREDVERQNYFSKMRTIQNAGSPNELIIERDIQMGQVQIDTILLCTDEWNLGDEKGQLYPITEDNVLDFLSPSERNWLYNEILDWNPIWRGETEAKNDSEPSLATSSTDSLPAEV